MIHTKVIEGGAMSAPREPKDGGHDVETDIPSRHQEPDPDIPEPDDETQDLVRPIKTAGQE